jgi:hypothetical protein
MAWEGTTLKILFKKRIGMTGYDNKVFKHPGWDDDDQDLGNEVVCWLESDES